MSIRSKIRTSLNEALTNADETRIKTIARDEIEKKLDKEFTKFLKSDDFKKKIEELVQKQLKNDSKTKKEVAEITKKVIVQLYKTFWTRRAFWSGSLEQIS